MYGYTKVANVNKDFTLLECLLFGALISATDPGMFCFCNIIACFFYGLSLNSLIFCDKILVYCTICCGPK